MKPSELRILEEARTTADIILEPFDQFGLFAVRGIKLKCGNYGILLGLPLDKATEAVQQGSILPLREYIEQTSADPLRYSVYGAFALLDIYNEEPRTTGITEVWEYSPVRRTN